MKHVLIPIIALFGLLATPVQQVQGVATTHFASQEYIPEPILLEILEDSCPHFGKCLPQMIDAYKAGSIKITKVDSYVYKVTEGGSNPIIIVIDSF